MPPSRILNMLRALAETPAGLTTTDLSKTCSFVPSDCGTTLRFHEGKGRVTRIGRRRAERGGYYGIADTWQITEEGRRYLAAHEAPRPGSPVWVWRECRRCSVRYNCIEGLPAATESVCLFCSAEGLS